MYHEDESQPLPPDPKLDAFLRILVGAVILLGGGFLLLEFVHWLAHGGLRPFLVGAAFTVVFFYLLILWSRVLSAGGRALKQRPSLYAFLGLLTAIGLLVQHFYAG
ncbi:hypothetical protein [Roseibacillus ishigakijimensis]|uniref:Uncharacterized protein n=1 Tax=Roseibacillus ishigakijimensis TaxID=454146 RepID=A0A934RQP2_9BACT|nr:hypothetical protein [Roseibacillus ishigakijimensis]MBK1832776.1 hypothetical protein [Roseibacillus ishigakijimensis]